MHRFLENRTPSVRRLRPPPISASTISSAKARAKSLSGANAAQQAKIDSITVKQVKKSDRSVGGSVVLAEAKKGHIFSGPQIIIYWESVLIQVGLTPEQANSPQAIAVLGVVIWHELYHLTDEEIGGLGGTTPGGVGVPGESDCRHIGLQWASMKLACAEAAAAAQGSDVRAALCKLFKGLRGSLEDWDQIARRCHDDGYSSPPPNPPGTGGPPSWSFPDHQLHNPINSPCEACP